MFVLRIITSSRALLGFSFIEISSLIRFCFVSLMTADDVDYW